MSNAVSSGAAMTHAHPDGKSTPSRRTFLATAGIAAASCATSAKAVGTLASEPDPVFQAIEAHKRAREGVKAAADSHCLLEREIVGAGIRLSEARANDQRIEASEDAMSRAFDVETDAACDILNIMPTTPAGVLALLSYAVEADMDGEGWPSDLCGGDDDNRGSWQQFLLASLAEILPAMMVRT
ncbi:hypothetical protein WN73_38480 [Bradyrhizobium sp. CCBAU 45394]|uniref:hypothetical protein n=1 Tax=Bradyrhizobium sp. CCBAU 45394 TaxID=1325087 RepID=UPI0023041EEC|nr:hypothetical protein [Bradyrhizobium sp. CCBAU 45394]MDA9396401.1 hypothetical protein [Bradyrhizobium sp. CCBAU 45394]